MGAAARAAGAVLQQRESELATSRACSRERETRFYRADVDAAGAVSGYEGKHFHYRHVNPWALTYHPPHPPMWIPRERSARRRGCGTRRRRDPYFRSWEPSLGPACDLWDYYADEAGQARIRGGFGKFRLRAANVGRLIKKERRNWPGIYFSAAARTLSRASRPYVAARIQLEGSDSETREAAAR